MGLFDFVTRKKNKSQDAGSASTEYCDDTLGGDTLLDPYGLLSSSTYDLAEGVAEWLSEYRNDLCEWGNGLGGFPATGTWQSVTYTTPTSSKKSNRRGELLSLRETLAREVAGDDWEYALVEADFTQALMTALNDEKLVECNSRWKASALIGAAEATCMFQENFPLDEKAIERTFNLIAKGKMKMFTCYEPDDNTAGNAQIDTYRHSLMKYASKVFDMQKIWSFASKQFTGHTGMRPVDNFESYMSYMSFISLCPVNKAQKEGVAAMAELTCADVLFDSYLAGVPVEDIIA